MTDLDLSFATVGERIEDTPKPLKSDGLDLSFATTDPVEIKNDDRSLMGKVYDFGKQLITGEGQNPENLEEITDYGHIDRALNEKNLGPYGRLGLLAKAPKQELRIAAGVMASLSPEGQADVVKNNIPGAIVEQDQKGNWVVEIDGQRGLINKPGASHNDLTQFAGQLLAFIPSAKIASFGGSLLGRMGLAGSTAALTSVGLDEAAQELGSEQPISGTNATLAGLFGASAELIAPLVPIMRKKIQATGLTDKTRDFVKQQFVKAGLKAEDATDDVIAQIAKLTDDQVHPATALAIQGEREFAIPLTRATRTMDDAQLSFEDRARSGALGEKPQRTIRDFERNEQLPAIESAKNTVVDSITGGVDDVTRPADAGAIIKDGIRTAERQADDIVSEAYSSVGDASLKPENVNALFNATRKAVIGIDKDRSLKGTKAILDQLKRGQRVFVELEKAGAKPKGKHLKEIETLRKRLGNSINTAENPTDQWQLRQLKNAYDDYLDNAVINGLFEGDAGALGSLKEARGLFSEYAKKFRAQPKKTKSGKTITDRDGDFIEKIVSADPTDEQVINALFGASNLSNTAGASMAKRFKAILGEGEQWNSVKKAGLLRLIKTNTVNGLEMVSGTKTLKAIDDALEKNGSLLKQLYAPEEIGLLRRFAAQVKRTQPDLVKSRENPSGTAQVLSKTVGDIMKRLPMLTGDLTLSVSAAGVQAGKGFRNGGKARDAIRPFSAAIQTSETGRAGIIELGREATN